MNSKEKLAAAKAARPFKDQQVILERAVSEEVAALEAELESTDSSDERAGLKSRADEIRGRLAELASEGADSVATIRVYRLPGRTWVGLTSGSAPRSEVSIDRVYGYNFDAVCDAALRYRDPKTDATFAFWLEDGETVEITPDEWEDLDSVLSGREYALLRDAVYALNEYEPQERLNSLVKG